jgi:hypothetical protein
VLKASCPLEVNWVTNASMPPPMVLCTAAKTGKSADWVSPATYTLPAPSSAIASPVSQFVPPK